MPFIEEFQRIVALEVEARRAIRHRLLVCSASGCLSSAGDAVREALAAEVKTRGLGATVQVKGVGCMGLCAAGPLVALDPAGVLYQGVQPSDAAEIVAGLDTAPVARLVCPTDTPFFTRRLKIVLESCGLIDPERIEDAIVAGGWEALVKALTEMSPGEVIEQITRSGLRGRGGGGYPTGLKWTTVAKAHGAPKYVICNADEGDPGAFMDRSVLESDPHRVLEGMTLAAYAIGATQGYVYVRAEYPVAVRRLQTAIKQARRLNLLGNSILGTQLSFHVDVRLGAGAFVCGEETALMASIEGRQGNPRPRPPYPAEHGLWGQPTLINNVETYANVPWIVRHGGDALAAIGTARSKGTKVFALAGKVRNTGLIEVPMGTPIAEIIEEIGGGVPGGGACKAVQTGGPSGGCIPADRFATPVDYESLRQLGSMMGSGGMIVMDSSSCMVDVARYFMEFCATESCGKCVPCRVGTAQVHDLLQRVVDGRAAAGDLELLRELCEVMQATSLCGLGQSAPNPVLSTLRFFAEEYRAHVEEHRCLAGACGEHGAPAGRAEVAP